MSKIEDLLNAFEDVTKVYRDALAQATYSILGTELELCAGTCGKLLYPRGQWEQIPDMYRRKLQHWVVMRFAYDRCTTCYRAAVRAGVLDAVPRSKILDDDEIEYLRRMASGGNA